MKPKFDRKTVGELIDDPVVMHGTELLALAVELLPPAASATHIMLMLLRALRAGMLNCLLDVQALSGKTEVDYQRETCALLLLQLAKDIRTADLQAELAQGLARHQKPSHQ